MFLMARPDYWCFSTMEGYGDPGKSPTFGIPVMAGASCWHPLIRYPWPLPMGFHLRCHYFISALIKFFSKEIPLSGSWVNGIHLFIILHKIQLVKNIFSVLLAVISTVAYSQGDSLEAAYLRFPTIPPFQLLEIDSSTIFSKGDLKKNQPVLLMYFSPDCDHCRHQTEDMLRDIKSFKKIQIVMATYQPFEAMQTFYRKYELFSHDNIHMGRDSKYILPPFYRIANLPYMALYDKKGNLITTFEGNQKVNKILKAFGKEK